MCLQGADLDIVILLSRFGDMDRSEKYNFLRDIQRIWQVFNFGLVIILIY